MKSSRFTIAVAFAMFVLLAPAFAQTWTIRVTAPFNFTVGKQTLAAGDYSVTVVNGPPHLQMVRIDGRAFASVLTNYAGAGPTQDLSPSLVFHCYGDRRFLSEVWIGDMHHGLFATATEMEYARTTHQERTVLAARMTTK